MSLSKAARKKKRWKQLQGAYLAGTTLRGRIVSTVKGGFDVRILETLASLPKEQLSGFSARDFPRLKDQELDVKITKLELQGRRVFVSHDLVTNPGKIRPKLIPRSTLREPKSQWSAAKSKASKLSGPSVCKHCGDDLPPMSSLDRICIKCYVDKQAAVRGVRGVVQGGSPGLKKKRTLRIGKTKRTPGRRART